MEDRYLKLYTMYLQQAGDWREVDVNDADRYCMYITSAVRTLLRAYLSTKNVQPESTCLISPLLKQCKQQHLVLPSSIDKCCDIWDRWETQHKTDSRTVVRRKTLSVSASCLRELADAYGLHTRRNFTMFDLRKQEED